MAIKALKKCRKLTRLLDGILITSSSTINPIVSPMSLTQSRQLRYWLLCVSGLQNYKHTTVMYNYTSYPPPSLAVPFHSLVWISVVFNFSTFRTASHRTDVSFSSFGQANQMYFFPSAPNSSQTCCLNCLYHLPSNDTPTFNSRSGVDVLSVYTLCL